MHQSRLSFYIHVTNYYLLLELRVSFYLEVDYKSYELFCYVQVTSCKFYELRLWDDFLKSLYDISYSFLRLLSTKLKIPSQPFLSNVFHEYSSNIEL